MNSTATPPSPPESNGSAFDWWMPGYPMATRIGVLVTVAVAAVALFAAIWYVVFRWRRSGSLAAACYLKNGLDCLSPGILHGGAPLPKADLNKWPEWGPFSPSGPSGQPRPSVRGGASPSATYDRKASQSLSGQMLRAAAKSTTRQQQQQDSSSLPDNAKDKDRENLTEQGLDIEPCLKATARKARSAGGALPEEVVHVASFAAGPDQSQAGPSNSATPAGSEPGAPSISRPPAKAAAAQLASDPIAVSALDSASGFATWAPRRATGDFQFKQQFNSNSRFAAPPATASVFQADTAVEKRLRMAMLELCGAQPAPAAASAPAEDGYCTRMRLVSGYSPQATLLPPPAAAAPQQQQQQQSSIVDTANSSSSVSGSDASQMQQQLEQQLQQLCAMEAQPPVEAALPPAAAAAMVATDRWAAAETASNITTAAGSEPVAAACSPVAISVAGAERAGTSKVAGLEEAARTALPASAPSAPPSVDETPRTTPPTPDLAVALGSEGRSRALQHSCSSGSSSSHSGTDSSARQGSQPSPITPSMASSTSVSSMKPLKRRSMGPRPAFPPEWSHTMRLSHSSAHARLAGVSGPGSDVGAGASTGTLATRGRDYQPIGSISASHASMTSRDRRQQPWLLLPVMRANTSASLDPGPPSKHHPLQAHGSSTSPLAKPPMSDGAGCYWGMSATMMETDMQASRSSHTAHSIDSPLATPDLAPPGMARLSPGPSGSGPVPQPLSGGLFHSLLQHVLEDDESAAAADSACTSPDATATTARPRGPQPPGALLPVGSKAPSGDDGVDMLGMPGSRRPGGHPAESNLLGSPGSLKLQPTRSGNLVVQGSMKVSMMDNPLYGNVEAPCEGGGGEAGWRGG